MLTPSPLGHLSEFDSCPVLAGRSIAVRPANEADFEPLYAAASDPEIWAQHPSPNRYRREVFKTEFWDTAATTGGLLMVLENQTGNCIGSSRFYQWNPADRSVVIGFTFLVTRHWGGPTNTELKALMLEHAFKTASSVWFHIGSNNLRSRRAVEKLGARFSHEQVSEATAQRQVVVHYRLDAST
jgi:RimJ/RimL family protein N-acetyltransferase